MKGDVYGFGVVLLELATGRKPVEVEYGETGDIVSWVCGKMARGGDAVMELVDSRIDEEFREEASRVLRVGVLCTMRLPSLRPTMRSVVQMLEELGRERLFANEGKDNL